MVKEAEDFADEDAVFKQRIEALNGLQNTVFQMESSLKDTEGLGSKLDASDKKTIQAAIKEKKEWLDANQATATSEEFEEQTAEFQGVVSPIVSKMYGGAAGDSQDSYGSHDEL